MFVYNIVRILKMSSGKLNMESLNFELVEPRSGSSEPARANTNVRGFVRGPKAGRSLLFCSSSRVRGSRAVTIAVDAREAGFRSSPRAILGDAYARRRRVDLVL